MSAEASQQLLVPVGVAWLQSSAQATLFSHQVTVWLSSQQPAKDRSPQLAPTWVPTEHCADAELGISRRENRTTDRKDTIRM